MTAHLLAGTVLAIPLIMLGATGALLVFEEAANDAANARLVRVEARGQTLPLDSLIARSAGSDHLLLLTAANIPARADRSYLLSFKDSSRRGNASGLFVDPYSGRVLGRLAEQRRPLQWVRDLHTGKLLGPASKAIDAWSALGLALLSLSGLLLWWRTKIFTVRAGAAGRRVLFDLHNAVGGYVWVLLFLFGATGAMMHWGSLTLTAASFLTGSCGASTGS